MSESGSPLKEWERSLEEQFFTEKNEQLLERLQEKARTASVKEAIQHATGLKDERVLEQLAGLKMGPAASAVLSLYPLVAVAWVKGYVDAKERQVVLEQAGQLGMSQGAAQDFVRGLLEQQPRPSLETLWTDYVKALKASLSADDVRLLKHEVLGRARLVAEAAGGFLGLGNKLSHQEAQVLERLGAVFG